MNKPKNTFDHSINNIKNVIKEIKNKDINVNDVLKKFKSITKDIKICKSELDELDNKIMTYLNHEKKK